MAKSNKSRFAILGMLALAPRSSGYDIKKLMEASTHYFWKESYSSIYPVLRTLIKEGLIIQYEDQSKKSRERHVYELTTEGKRELQEWVKRPVEYEQPRNELLLKLFFGECVPPMTTRKHVEEFYQMLIKKDKIYQAIQDKLFLNQKNEPGLPYWLLTVDFGLGQVKAALKWCETVLKHEVYGKV